MCHPPHGLLRARPSLESRQLRRRPRQSEFAWRASYHISNGNGRPDIRPAAAAPDERAGSRRASRRWAFGAGYDGRVTNATSAYPHRISLAVRDGLVAGAAGVLDGAGDFGRARHLLAACFEDDVARADALARRSAVRIDLRDDHLRRCLQRRKQEPASCRNGRHCRGPGRRGEAAARVAIAIAILPPRRPRPGRAPGSRTEACRSFG